MKRGTSALAQTTAVFCTLHRVSEGQDRNIFGELDYARRQESDNVASAAWSSCLPLRSLDEILRHSVSTVSVSIVSM